jgi:uncharacterized membrane protein
MKCPQCQRENEPASRFCIYCGAVLKTPETESAAESGSGGEVEGLRRDIRRIEGLLDLMNERLVALERAPGRTEAPPQSVTSQPPEPAQAPEKASLPRPEVEVRQPAMPAAAEVPPAKPEQKTAAGREWEQILGGHWLARIGVIALVIGIGFFLKYAFDNDWIGPTGRVVLGIVAGLLLLGGGHYWRKKYPVLSQALSGGGIAVLYLSIFAAYVVYQLTNFYVAFGFLLVISIASAVLALRYNAMALAIIGILGAFIAPFILAASGPEVPGAAGSPDTGFWLLMGYVTVVDIGVLVLSTFRNWRWFTLMALIGSLAVFGLLQSGNVSTAAAMWSLTIIFLIFVGATTLFHIVWRRPAQAFDEILIVFNGLAYFGISYGLLWSDYRVWLGGFSLLLALFYGGIAYIVLRRGAENVRLGFFALGIALVFLTIAVPVQIGDRAWTTIAWAAEGLVLVWLSFALRMPTLRSYAYPVFAVTTIKLLFFDQIVDTRNYKPVLNERFLAFAVSIAAFYLAGYLLRRMKEGLREWEQGVLPVYPALFVAANFFTVWLLSAEVINYFDTSMALTLLWAIYAVLLLVVGMVKQWRPVRLWALVLLAVPVLKLFVYDVFTLKLLYRIIAFVGLGVLLLISAYLYSRYNKSIRGFIAKK